MNRMSWVDRWVWGVWVVVGLLGGTSWGAANYVWQSGSQTPPYTNWATAAHDIQTAVDFASTNYPTYDTVVVTNDTYVITAQIAITNGITVRGFSGNAADVIVTRSSSATNRIFFLSHPDAVLEGVTVSNGLTTVSGAAYEGAGVYMTTGTLRNCIMDSNRRLSLGNGSGGGVYMVGGLMTNCIVRNNSASSVTSWCYTYGGGVYAAGGAIRNCRIEKNAAYGVAGYGATYGGGIYMTGSPDVWNCLIVSNSLMRDNGAYFKYEQGAGVYLGGGSLIHCTVADNTGFYGSVRTRGASGGIHQEGGTARNCIVYFNTSGGVAGDYVIKGGVREYCCAPELTFGTGTGNITADPRFVDRAGRNYHLKADSVCLDAGTNLATVASDLDGNTRPLDGDGNGTATADMGCYEFVAGLVFTCNYGVSTNFGLQQLNGVVFTATVAGPSGTTNIARYRWDFGNGTAEGLLATNSFGLGKYTVTLTVSNTLGQVTNAVKTDFIRVLSDQVYVRTNVAGQYPYDTWDKATANPNLALAALVEATCLAGAATGDIWLSNGVFDVSAELSLIAPLRLHGVSGAQATALRRPGPAEYRILSLLHAGALVENLTITNGFNSVSGTAWGGGGGVYMTNGTLRNCIVDSNSRWTAFVSVSDNSLGGGIHMTGGLVTNCVVRNNTADVSSGNWIRPYGGGVYAAGGTLRDCRIEKNATYGSQAYGDAYGGGLYLTGSAEAKNCLIVSNTIRRGTGSYTDYERGGGVWMNGGSLVNCTMADNVGVYGSTNATVPSGGGVYQGGGGITNCIVYFNTVSNKTDNYAASGGFIAFSCAPELTSGTGNLTNDPLFKATGAYPYSLESSSPCVDHGTNQTWMTNALDLAGSARIFHGTVDMGAYETWIPPRGAVFFVR